MIKKTDKTGTEELARSMNEDGLEVWEGMIISCAKTGRVFQSEPIEFSCDAHAEVDGAGRLIFVLHRPCANVDPQQYH